MVSWGSSQLNLEWYLKGLKSDRHVSTHMFVTNQIPIAWKPGLMRNFRQRFTEEPLTHTAIYLPGCIERMLHMQIRKLPPVKNNMISHPNSRQNITKVNREPEIHRYLFVSGRAAGKQNIWLKQGQDLASPTSWNCLPNPAEPQVLLANYSRKVCNMEHNLRCKRPKGILN